MLEPRALCSATYYVSPAGDDTAAGTSPAHAWRTVERVNATDLNPGDRVLFEGGRTFAGHLVLDSDDAGTAAAPVIVASFGRGRATIDAGGDGAGIYAHNAGGVQVRDLIVRGAAGGGDSSGINFYNDLPGDVLLDAVSIDRVDVSGFGGYGVAVGGWNGHSGYRGLRVTRSVLHHNGSAGLITYAETPKVNQQVYVGSVSAYANRGGALIIGDAAGATVERCTASDNTSPGGRPAMWAYDSDRVTFQRNRAIANRSDAGDGGAFGFIWNVSNSVMQNNDSRDNDGPGYVLAHYAADGAFAGHVVRHNASRDDGRRTGTAGLLVRGPVADTLVSGNTFRLTANAAPTRNELLKVTDDGDPTHNPTGLRIEGNTFTATGRAALVDVADERAAQTSSVAFRSNRYRAGDGGFRVKWGETTWRSLAEWTAATGQEPR